MKRIKEYINKHPKLKRIVKILGVVAIVFSFLFNALIIAGVIINATYKPKDNKVLAYGDYTPVERRSMEGQYNVTYFMSDFTSYTFIEETYQLLTESTNIGLTGYTGTDFLNGTLIDITGVGNGALLRYINDSGDAFTQPGNAPAGFFNITHITFQKNNSDTALHYTFSIHYATNHNKIVFDYRRYYYSESAYQWNSLTTFYSNNTATLLASSDVNLVFTFGKDAYINCLGTGNPRYTDYYNKGYNDGYDLGYEYGYGEGEDYGYDQGYYNGLQAGEAGESTMFTLISQAFNAVASILDIQVLPNLSLGILIFTPLIVTVVIVIVKMVKG